MLQEFRTFVMRGNVLDLAVAVVMGAAFGKIVSSFVSDVLMPPIGLLLGRVDFSNLFVSLSGESYPSLAAAKAAGAPTLNYGLFLNTVLEFVIVAFAVFLLVRQVNRLRRPVAAPAPPDTRECPFCATAIPARARRCPNCTSALTLLVVVGALALAAPALAQTAPSPYTGQDGRDLKALAPEEVRSLLAGEGMGFAKSAELNRYPGPRHVLDLAGPLRLTDEQRRATQAVYERMRERARGIGAAIVERERRLDALFAAGTIDEASLRVLTAEIGRLTGELRELHLTAHLETRRLLTFSQVAAYDRLRGYDGSRERGGDVEGQPAGAHGGHRP